MASSSRLPYVHAMFSIGHDEANREVFKAEDADSLNQVGLAIRGPKKVVDKVIKGLKLHKKYLDVEQVSFFSGTDLFYDQSLWEWISPSSTAPGSKVW